MHASTFIARYRAVGFELDDSRDNSSENDQQDLASEDALRTVSVNPALRGMVSGCRSSVVCPEKDRPDDQWSTSDDHIQTHMCTRRMW